MNADRETNPWDLFEDVYNVLISKGFLKMWEFLSLKIGAGEISRPDAERLAMTAWEAVF